MNLIKENKDRYWNKHGNQKMTDISKNYVELKETEYWNRGI